MKNSKLTKRKFYNKWLYKITLNIPGIGSIRYRSINEFINFITSSQSSGLHYYLSSSTVQKIRNNSKMILSFLTTLQSVPENEWGKRIENDNIDVYTNNKVLFDSLSNQFRIETVHRFEPVNEQQLLENGNVYVVNQYPHGKYQYKVFLRPHKLSNKEDRKMQFLAWIDTQGDRIRISDSVKDWFIHMNWNWDRRYMYVEDEQTLLMLKMRESDALGKVYKYLLADK